MTCGQYHIHISVPSLIPRSSKPSGGTLNTVFNIMETYSLKQIRAAGVPYAISPIPGPGTKDNTSIVTKIFGIRAVRDLGILTSSLGGMADTPIVQRSWGLLGGNKFYGPNFRFHEYMKARNHLSAIFIHFALVLGSVMLAIPFMRTIGRKLVYQPGEGPTKEESKRDRFEYRGIGIPDVATPNPPRAFCKAAYEGSLYECKFLLECYWMRLTRSSHRALFGTGCALDSPRPT